MRWGKSETKSSCKWMTRNTWKPKMQNRSSDNGYPTARQPVAKEQSSMNKKSVSAEKWATNLQSDALAHDNLLSSPLKSLEEDGIPPTTEKKHNQKKKSTSRPIEESASTSEVILHPTAVNDNLFSSPLKLLEEHVIPDTTGKKHNQRDKSISNGKSPTSDVLIKGSLNIK